MPSNTLLSLASAVLVAVPYVEAQILSCADVECPINPGTTSAKCTVVDKTFNAVGVAELSTDLDDFKKLSWVKAVGAEDGSTDSVYDQTFYLGTPEGFSFSGTGACALFFSEVSSEVKFGDGDARMTTGTCKEALSDDCVSALVDRAKAVDLKGLSNTDACAKLQRDFSDNLDSACSKFATGKSWAGIRAQGKLSPIVLHMILVLTLSHTALSGNGSPEPISEKQNATSNCWPIVPKADGLRVVESINVTVSFSPLKFQWIFVLTLSRGTCNRQP